MAAEKVVPVVSTLRSLRTPSLRQLASGLTALTLCLGTVALVGILDGLDLAAGAATPPPTLYVNNYSANTVLSFPLSATGNVAPATILSDDGSGSVAQPWG